MVLRFAGFELDRQQAELRGPDGTGIKLRPKTLGILELLATNAGRVLSKQELMEAVWPNIHVGDDSLFQCIREARTAIGDDQRQLIKLVSGRGYLFTAEVSIDQAPAATRPPSDIVAPRAEAGSTAETVRPKQIGMRRLVVFTLAGFCALTLLAIVTTTLSPGALFGRKLPTIAITPLAAADGEAAAMAANVTTRLADGLAKIETIRVSAPFMTQTSRPPSADFVVQGELRKNERSWDVRVRMTRLSTGDIVWTEPVSVPIADTDLPMQQSRLAAGIGHSLAIRIAELLTTDARPASGGGSLPRSSNAAIEQATASIMKTTRERFATAQAMLEKALGDDPENVELAVSLAALQLRGIQMVWYDPSDSAMARINARSILEHALRVEPNSVAVLEAYCRFLNATNEFVESLVACTRALNVSPWDGMALYHIGLAQIQLGRFEDALATFQQADRFDTPQVSRWTWLLGAGWVNLILNRNEDAVTYLERSIAITPASGRSQMLLAVAYQRQGRFDEARATMAKGLALRPGSTIANVAPPTQNASEVFLAASQKIIREFAQLGLPES